MAKFSIPHSFEPTESLKHDYIPKKAAVLGAVSYLENHHMYHYNSESHWDKERAKQRILDMFELKIKQEWINKLVLSMPERLQDCLSRGGALTGW